MTLSTERRLVRSRSDRMLFGVCGGLGEYLGVDPTLVRLAFVLLMMAGGVSVVVYPILVFVMPMEGRRRLPRIPVQPEPPLASEPAPIGPSGAPIRSELGDQYVSTLDDDLAALARKRSRKGNRLLASYMLVGLGLVFLLSNMGFFWWLNWRLWPLVLVGIGLALLLGNRRSQRDL